MVTWERTTGVNAGGWRVFDDRLVSLTPHGTRSFTYYGYTKREAMSVHAQTVRELQGRPARVNRDKFLCTGDAR